MARIARVNFVCNFITSHVGRGYALPRESRSAEIDSLLSDAPDELL
jgi:hypothetical protein